MLSAFYDYTVSRVKTLFGWDSSNRKRRIDETDNECSPNAKLRRIEKPLGAKNFSGSISGGVSAMSNHDRSHLVHTREYQEEGFSWEKRNIGKENQLMRNSSCQASDSDVVVLDDDLSDVSHLKPCNHGFRQCQSAHTKDNLVAMQGVRRKTRVSQNEEVHAIDDDDDDVVFIKDSRQRNQAGASMMSWKNPLKLSRPMASSLGEKPRMSDSSRGSLFSLGLPSEHRMGGGSELRGPSSGKKLDSPSVKSRIRNGNLSRAAVLRKSLPPPPTYFGVEAKLCSRWTGLDEKIKKKPSALALCSAIDEMKAYNHMLQQFTSDSAPKQMNTRFDSQAFKLFESQLRRNNSFAQLMKKKVSADSSQAVEIIDLSDDDVQEIGIGDEAKGSAKETKPENDLVEIVRKESDVVQVWPRKINVQRSRERIPKASGESMDREKIPTWSPPNAVEQMIKKSHVADEDFLKNIVEKFADEKAKIGKELEREELKKKLWSERRQKFESSLEDRLKRYMKITDVVLEEEISEEEEELPELTTEMLDCVHDALQKGRSCVLARLGSNTITGADIQTLADSNWLNDEVINNYMDMLTQRGQSNEYPSVHCFNTFFYPKLNSSGYSSVRRWTKKVDIFQKEILIVPLHLEIHWALAVVDFRQKSICYYDSMNGRKKNILQVILKYLQEEKNDKKKENFDGSGWELKLIQDIPQQRNGYDCGVFACMFAEHLSRGLANGSKGSSKCKRPYPPFPFSQDNMPYFRKRMIYEILSGKLLQ
ncbi:uncharacterized protein LOC124167936 [Ischnura elegans]|uniref:uncharacterized protein LOC124167936 n=1 Tax=Ischnura elegans TaxID=197161 RepID=UPI001ED87052|nr:uncharacterized protein LOC124167936 [Ischnura elegans]